MARHPIVVWKPGENVCATYMKGRMFRKNSSNNVVAVGEPGVGKSWAMISLLCEIDPTFTVDRVFFRASAFLQVINDGDLPRGSCIMLDEVGVDLNNLSWQNEINRSMNLVFQTIRFKNYTIGMTLPYTNFLSKGVRTLLTCKLQVMGWSKNTKLNTIRPRILQYNSDLDKTYAKRLIVRKGNDSIFCNNILLPAPPDGFDIKEYERRKKTFTDQLYANCQVRVSKFEQKQATKEDTKFTKIQTEIVRSLKDGLVASQLAVQRGVTVTSIYEHLTAIKKKGIVLQGVRNDKNELIKYEVTDPYGL